MPRDPNEGDPGISGFPQDGDTYPNPNEDAGNPPDPNPSAPEPNELDTMKARMAKLEADLAEARRSTPPPQPPAPKLVDEDDPLANIEEELYRDPKATLKKVMDHTEKRITERLTSQYQRDRGTQKFWEQFYDKHPDLKNDHDLVEVTLNSNLAEMSSMSVDKALNHLADLTRDRILRYAGGAGKSRVPKARVEGSQPPSPSPSKPKETEIVSISDIIKRKRELRRKAASGV